MEIIRFFQGLTNAFWGEYSYQVLFYLSLFLIMIFWKKTHNKVVIICYSVFTLLAIYNPGIYYLSQVFFTRKSGLMVYYCRLFCLIPIVFIIAYAMVLALRQTAGWKKIVGTILIMGVIAICGHSAYGEDWLVKAENVNKVPEDVIQLSYMFQEDDLISIMAPTDLVPYMRQIDSRFSMPYGRDRSKLMYSDQLQSEAPDVDLVINYAIETNTEYIVALYIEEAIERYIQHGCEVVGYTNHYVVLRKVSNKDSISKGVVVTQYYDISGSQAMFYTIETETEDLIVIDGGTVSNADYVREILAQHNNHVTYWILSHPHPDHIGAFNAIFEDLKGIRIDNIITIDMDYNLYKEVAEEWDDFSTYDKFIELTQNTLNIQYVHTGDILEICGLEMQVYNAYDETTIDYSVSLANEGSIVFKLSNKKESMLFCSDVFGSVFCNKIINQFGDELKADYIQMGHHGNNSMTKDFVSVVQPKVAFFDAPEWLINGKNYDTQSNIKMMEEMGVSVYTYIDAPHSVIIN